MASSANIEHETGGKTVIPPNSEIEVVTSPGDVETVLVDGIKGVTILNEVVRINFIESYGDTLGEGGLRGRHVITIAMSRQSLPAIMALLNQVVADVQTMPELNPPT